MSKNQKLTGAAAKKVQKVVEDKTFGLKNKKGKKGQQIVKTVQSADLNKQVRPPSLEPSPRPRPLSCPARASPRPRVYIIFYYHYGCVWSNLAAGCECGRRDLHNFSLL